MAELCSKTVVSAERIFPTVKLLTTPKKIVCYKLTLNMSDNFSIYDAQVLDFVLSTDEFEWEETTTKELSDFSIIENANSSKIKPTDERFRM